MILLRGIILFFLHASYSKKGSNKDHHAETRLVKHLFNNDFYSKDVRPVYNKSKSVLVKLNIAFSYLIELNDRDQSLNTNIWLRQFWKNEFLQWKPGDFDNITQINVNSNLVWTPDLVLYNSLDKETGQFDQYPNRVQLRNDGQNTWYIPAIVTSSCKVDIRYYPFDYQRCKLTIGSWAYLASELDVELTRKDIDLEALTPSLSFNLIETKAKRNIIKHSCCATPFVDATFSVVIQRQAGTFVQTVMLPSVILTFNAATMFAFPPNIGQRIGLATSCFLTIAVIMQMSTGSLPVDSTHSSLIGQFMLLCIAIITSSIALNTVRLNLNRNTPVPNWMRMLLLPQKEEFRKEQQQRKREEEIFLWDYSNTSCLEGEYNTPYSSRLHAKFSEEEVKVLQRNRRDVSNFNMLIWQTRQTQREEFIAEFWDACSRVADRLFLVTFSFAYIVIIICLFLQVQQF